MASLVRTELGTLEHWLTLPGTISTFTLDEATDQIEYIFQAQEAATLTRLGFRYGTRTGTPPTYKISLQGVDGSGRADGTIKGGGTPASATFTPPADTSWNSTWQWITLDNAFTVARGDYLAVVILYNAGTINGSNSSSFATASSGYKSDGGLPYNVTFNATGSVVSRTAGLPVYGYASAGTAYGAPMSTSTSLTVNSGTTPDEVALFFSLPSGLANTYQVIGARLGLVSLTAATTHKVILYDGTTVLQDVTFDSDYTVATTRPHMDITFDEATLSTLVCGNPYRLAVQPQAATSVSVAYQEVAANADFAAWPMGTGWYWSQRTDAGAWSDTTTRRPLILPLLASISTTGGMLVHPGTQGGMRG
jgi:hypothetical protein